MKVARLMINCIIILGEMGENSSVLDGCSRKDTFHSFTLFYSVENSLGLLTEKLISSPFFLSENLQFNLHGL